MIIRSPQTRVFARTSRFAAFGYYAIDPNSLTLPSISDIMGGIDIFSDDVYRITGDAGCPHSHRDGSPTSFYGLWATLQSTINGAFSNVDKGDALAAPIINAIKTYLGKLGAAIESSKSAMKSMGDDQSKAIRATNLCTCFAVMKDAVATLPGIIQNAQASIAQRAQQAAASAAAAAQAQAQAQAAAAQQAAAEAQAAQLQAQTQATQAATQQANAVVALDTATQLQQTADKKLAGAPIGLILAGLGVVGGGYAFYRWRRSKRAARSTP